jgi:hypothetical protein
MRLVIYQIGGDGGKLAEREADRRPRRGETLTVAGREFVVNSASWTGKGQRHAIYVTAPDNRGGSAAPASESENGDSAVSSFDAALRAMMKG